MELLLLGFFPFFTDDEHETYSFRWPDFGHAKQGLMTVCCQPDTLFLGFLFKANLDGSM